MKTPEIINGIIVSLLITIPILLTTIPIIKNTLQDQFPDEIKKGNPFYILFSPILDREGIRRGETSKKTMENAIRTGTSQIADVITSPVLTGIYAIQTSIGSTIETIREGVRKSLTIPTRGLYTMSSTMARGLNTIFGSVLGTFVGMIRKIQDAFNELATSAMIMIYTQMTAYNSIFSVMGFFMFLLKVLGGVVITFGILLLPSIFLIPLGIALITVGSIMVDLSINSERVIQQAIRYSA
jgi:hypothetical protein